MSFTPNDDGSTLVQFMAWCLTWANIGPDLFCYTRPQWLNSIMASIRSEHDDVIMETFSALLAFCAGNSPVSGEFPAQRPVTRSFDVFFDLHPNKRLSKQWWGWWFETLSRSLWRHRNEYISSGMHLSTQFSNSTNKLTQQPHRDNHYEMKFGHCF